jgi:hypothetical protein
MRCVSFGTVSEPFEPGFRPARLIDLRNCNVPVVSGLDQSVLLTKKAPTLEDLIDREFVEYSVREADDRVTLEEVFEATTTIKESMASVIIEVR